MKRTAFGIGALCLTLTACAQANLATATKELDRAPQEALAAQIAPPATVTRALQSTGVATTSFGRSVHDAVLLHPTVRGQTYRIAGASAVVQSAESAYRPRLSVGFDAGYSAYSASTSGPRIGPVVSLTKLVYDGSASRYALLSRREALAVAQIDRIVETTSLTLKAVETRINVLRSRAISDVTAQNLAAHEDLVEKIGRRVEAGAGSQADLLAGRSRLASASAQSIEAARNAAQAEAAWYEIYGSTPPAALSWPPHLSPSLIPGGAEDTRRNPQLVRLDFLINQALFDLAGVEAGRQPAVDARITAGPTVGQTGLSVDAQANLGVRVQLLSGGERAAKIKEAQARVDELKSQRDQLERRIVKALEFSRSDQAAGAQRLTSADLALQAAEESLVTAREQFLVGRRSITQMLDAQKERTDAALLKVNSKADLILGSYSTLGLTGDLLSLFGVDPLMPGDQQ